MRSGEDVKEGKGELELGYTGSSKRYYLLFLSTMGRGGGRG
jgi:hypothetical protein